MPGDQLDPMLRVHDVMSDNDQAVQAVRSGRRTNGVSKDKFRAVAVVYESTPAELRAAGRTVVRIADETGNLADARRVLEALGITEGREKGND